MKKINKIIDRHGRCLNYMRVSVTDRCNLNCLYCNPKGSFSKLSHKEILTYEEIMKVLKVGARMGIKKVRITGGEPLTRKGICEFIRKVSGIDGIDDVSLTTNGVRLKEKLDRLIWAGITRINVSLDTLNRKNFHRITGSDCFDQVWEGIKTANLTGLFPIKLNTVVIKGINDHEIEDLAALTFKYPFHIRFIEYMPMGHSFIGEDRLIQSSDVEEKIATLGELVPIDDHEMGKTARRFRLRGALGEIGLISPVSQHFCSRCNRLRLTANGKIRPCLLSDIELDIKTSIRNNSSNETIEKVFYKAANSKSIEHNLLGNKENKIVFRMVAIGG